MARQHRSHSVAFKRQVAEEFLAGETLHGLAKRHDLCRNLIRVWVAKYEAGGFDDDAGAADLIEAYEDRIAALERLVGKQALELEFPKGASASAARAKNAPTSVITGPRGLSIAQGCRLMGLPRSTFYDVPATPADEAEIVAACARSATSSKPTAIVASAPRCATRVRSIFAQRSVGEVWAQHARVVEQLQDRFAAAADLLLMAAEDILAFAGFPSEYWRQIWSNNPLERLHREIRRRTDVVGIFPNRAAVIRLVGAVLAEQHDDWLVTRRYMAMEGLAKALAANQEPQSQLAA
jgi:transposase-like protein